MALLNFSRHDSQLATRQCHVPGDKINMAASIRRRIYVEFRFIEFRGNIDDFADTTVKVGNSSQLDFETNSENSGGFE